jgi:chemotaxis protein methyltransferase CheR
MTASLRDTDFAAVRDFLSGAAGLAFDESRRAALAAVVSERLKATGASSVADYLDGLAGPGGAGERQRLMDRVTVQETYFFRNLPQIDALRHRVLPDLLRRAARRDRPLTIWSAGCSTGEEAYTIAMLVQDLAPRSTAGTRDELPAARILATDVSAAALAVAERATYSGRTLDAVPAMERDRWFVPRAGRTMAVRDDVRRMVELRQQNLITDAPPFGPGEVDLIVCRNVTIYFSRATTRALIGSFHDVLDDSGYLMLGHSETLWQVSDAFTLVPLGEAFVYRRGGARRIEVSPSVTPRRLRPAHPRRHTSSATSPAAAVVRRPPAVQDHLASAREALDAGDYRETARLAELAIAADSLVADSYVVLGHARSALGLDAQAVEPLRKAVYLEPAAGHAHFLLAGALSRLGLHGPAAVSYRAAAQSLPAVPEPMLRTFLGGRPVAELADVCQRLAHAATEMQADVDVVAATGRTAS